jgi:hypothetical protein
MFAVLLELTCMAYFLWAKPVDLGSYGTYPTYLNLTRDNVYRRQVPHDPLGPHIIDTLLPWGTWHTPNSLHRYQNECADALMRFNAMGCRGGIPDAQSDSTVLFIGDSFTEGSGLGESATVPAKYSSIEGVPTLNLGVASIGTTQMSLIYRHFASRFRHRRVFVMFYLFNDIQDNDIHEYPPFYRRYRPYRSDTASLKHLVYLGNPDSSHFSWKTFRQSRAEGFSVVQRYGWTEMRKKKGSYLTLLPSLTFTARCLAVFSKRMSNASQDKKPGGYLYLSDRSRAILEYDVRDMMHTADSAGAVITFLNIPDKYLLAESRTDSTLIQPYRQMESMIRRIAESGGHRYASFHDFLKGRMDNPASLYYTCEEHLTEPGAALLAEFLAGIDQTAAGPEK